MKKIGIIGGMSWESSLEYYRQINRLVQERIGGLSSASCIMDSVDFGPIADLMESENWDAIAALLGDSAQRLAGAGAEIMVVATNTMHLLYEEISDRAGVPVIHIADATGDAVRHAGVTKLALLGTKFTMEKPFYTERLSRRYGVQVLIPPAKTRLVLNRIIFEELCRGEFRKSSTRRILEMIVDLTEQGAEGIALACTELPLVIGQDDAAIPIFDTLSLHCRAAVDAALC